MAIPISYLNHGVAALQTGAFRMPMLFASLNGALLAGEGVFRATTAILGGLGFNGFMQKVHDNTPTIAIRVMRPYKDLKPKELVVSVLACSIIGILGTHAVAWAFGQAPAIYNNVLTWLGPIRISNDLHPLIAYAKTALGY